MPSNSAARVAGPAVRRRVLFGALLAATVLLGSSCSSVDSSDSEPLAAGPPAIASTASTSIGSTSIGPTSIGPTTGGTKATGTKATGATTTLSGAASPETNLGQAAIPPATSLIATASGARVTVRGAPDDAVRKTLKNPTTIGAPLTFRVLEQRPGWLKVQLPVRPNGSSGWIAAADVSVSSTPYRLVISMSQHRLDVMYEGRRIARHKIGVGAIATPTPKGTYYLTELIQPPDPAGPYGPYAFGLSAFSNTLKTFAGGPGQLGLHGTNVPKGLGSDISHGCIRVANDVITQLAGDLPLGTPVDIQ